MGQQNTPTVRTDTCDCSFSLSSSDPNVATIAADGRTIVACGGGSATITATAYNGKKATLALTVPYLPDSIALEPAAITLGRGDSIALKAVMPQGQDSTLRWYTHRDMHASASRHRRLSLYLSASDSVVPAVLCSKRVKMVSGMAPLTDRWTRDSITITLLSTAEWSMIQAQRITMVHAVGSLV